MNITNEAEERDWLLKELGMFLYPLEPDASEDERISAQRGMEDLSRRCTDELRFMVFGKVDPWYGDSPPRAA